MPVGRLHLLFGKMSLQFFCPVFLTRLFVFLALSCMSCWCVLDISPCWVHGFLRCVKTFKFNEVPFVLFIFTFISFRKGIQYCCDVCQSALPMFSSRNFIEPCFTFRSLIYFEFIFVYGIREYCNFILLHGAIQLSPHHLLKRLSFLHCIFLPSVW